MKKIFLFIVIILFSFSLQAYEVKTNYKSIDDAEAFMDDTDETHEDYKVIKPTKILVDKTHISYSCKAKLSATPLKKNEKGQLLVMTENTIELEKDLGKLQPDEELFPNANWGRLNFNFTLKKKKLVFDMRIQGPEPSDDQDSSKMLYMSLAYHKTFKGKGPKRTVASKEISDIHIDADKTLPGGFTLHIFLKDVIKQHSSSIDVHCTNPVKQIRQVETYADL